MKKLILSAIASLFVANLAFVQAAHAGAQQEKMKACNAEAKDKKGEERKAFMKECLSAKKAGEQSAKSPQQDKMKSCNAEAKTKALKGGERKKFMSDCLKA